MSFVLESFFFLTLSTQHQRLWKEATSEEQANAKFNTATFNVENEGDK